MTVHFDGLPVVELPSGLGESVRNAGRLREAGVVWRAALLGGLLRRQRQDFRQWTESKTRRNRVQG